jgi:CBS domain-containing membrane protein
MTQLPSTVRGWLRRWAPAPLPISRAERWRVIGGVALGVLVMALVSKWAEPLHVGWLIAPVGASAVLVFGLPGSPLAQPWSVVAGNTLSALVGTACALLVPDGAAGGALAVALAFGAMLAGRCLHPPGGAIALMAVLSHSPSWSFAVVPVLTSSVLLVALAVAYHAATGHTYPHRHAGESAVPQPDGVHRFTRADLDQALAHYNELIDVDPDDLVNLLQHAEAAAYQRTLGELRCEDVMTRNPMAVEYGTALSEAWAVMRTNHIKALPVIDRARRIVGIVTFADFLNMARLDDHDGLAARLQSLLRPSGLLHSERPEVVGQIMTRQVRVVSAQRHAVELLPLFSEAGHHHLPVIDEERRLVGVLTQSDLVRALSQAVRP